MFETFVVVVCTIVLLGWLLKKILGFIGFTWAMTFSLFGWIWKRKGTILVFLAISLALTFLIRWLG